MTTPGKLIRWLHGGKSTRRIVIATVFLMAILSWLWFRHPSDSMESKVEALLARIRESGGEIGESERAHTESLGPGAAPVLATIMRKEEGVGHRLVWRMNSMLPDRFQSSAIRSRDWDMGVAFILLVDSSFGHDTFPAMMEMIKDSRVGVRYRASNILAEFATARDSVYLKELESALRRESDSETRVYLAAAMGKIDPSSFAVDQFIRPMLKARNPDFQELAKQLLDSIQSESRTQARNVQEP